MEVYFVQGNETNRSPCYTSERIFRHFEEIILTIDVQLVITSFLARIKEKIRKENRGEKLE